VSVGLLLHELIAKVGGLFLYHIWTRLVGQLLGLKLFHQNLAREWGQLQHQHLLHLLNQDHYQPELRNCSWPFALPQLVLVLIFQAQLHLLQPQMMMARMLLAIYLQV
jgi:hypothetical protein